MTALKWITNKAKSIRKGSKTMTWKAAIKKAGAEYRASHKAKPVKKTVKKKTVIKKPTQYKSKTTGRWKNLTDDDKEHLNDMKKYHYKLRGVDTITGNYASKRKAAPRAKHIDTKSHNVNVRVVSGVRENLDKLHKLHYNIYDLIKVNENEQRKIKQAIVFNGKLGEHFYTKPEIAIFRKQLVKLKKVHTQLKKIAREQEKAVNISK